MKQLSLAIALLLLVALPAEAQVDVAFGYDNVYGKGEALTGAFGLFGAINGRSFPLVNVIAEGGVGGGSKFPYQLESGFGCCSVMTAHAELRHVTALGGFRVARRRGTTAFAQVLAGLRTFTVAGS